MKRVGERGEEEMNIFLILMDGLFVGKRIRNGLMKCNSVL